jgi:hypothetical protein
MNLNSLRCPKCKGTIDVNSKKTSDLFCIFCGSEFSYSDFENTQNSPTPVSYEAKANSAQRNNLDLSKIDFSKIDFSQIKLDFPLILKLIRYVPPIIFVIIMFVTFFSNEKEENTKDTTVKESTAESIVNDGSELLTIPEFDNLSEPLFSKKLIGANGLEAEVHVQGAIEKENELINIVAKVVNTGNSPLTNISVDLNLLNAKGKIIRTIPSMAINSYLEPQGVSFIEFEISQKEKKYKYDFVSNLENNVEVSKPELVINNLEFRYNSETKNLAVKGNVENKSASLNEYPKVYLLLFDSEVKILTSAIEYTVENKLESGANGHFEINLSPMEVKPAGYKIISEGLSAN